MFDATARTELLVLIPSNIWGDPWAENMIQHLNDLIADPSTQWGEEGLGHLIGARKALLSRTGSLLICAGRDGVERAFEHRFEKDQFDETWHFCAQTVPPQFDGAAFDLSVTALDGARVRQVILAHHDNPAYATMGIPDALIPVVAAALGKKVVSSPTTADDAGVYRTVAATKVWDRLVAKGVATFDPAADVYEYTGAEAAR